MGYQRGQMPIGEVYHVFTKSIAGFKIFNDESEFMRMKQAMLYYQLDKLPVRFSWLLKVSKEKIDSFRSQLKEKNKLVEIVAYCFMPTHLHLVLKQVEESGISIFMNNALNSYTRYFNTKHKRKGPLWEGRFKSVLVKNEEQLLHLTRYVHLNPTTACLVDKPQEWAESSYSEYLSKGDDNDKICRYSDILDIEPVSYREFVEDRIAYQRELARIKELTIEETVFHTAAV